MIDSQEPAEDVGTSQVVDGQVTASLIFIFKKPKAFALASVSIADQVKVCGIAKLAKDDDNITFRQVKWETTYIDPGCIAVISMPRSFRGSGFVRQKSVPFLSLSQRCT